MKKNLRMLLSLALLVLFSATYAGETRIMTLTDGWVRAMPPGMSMTAAFGIVANDGEGLLELVSWDSNAYDEVTLHRTVLEQGVSQMREVGNFELEAGAALIMRPGSYHLMLMQPNGELAPGDVITLGVTTAGGLRFEFEVPVKKR